MLGTNHLNPVSAGLFKGRIAVRRGSHVFSKQDIICKNERQAELLSWFKSEYKLSRIQFPILLSVLKGDIGFYGTSITTIVDYKEFLISDKGYWRKFLVKPGIFGPGYYGKTPEEKFELDLKYLEKTSFLNDTIMLIKQICGLKPIQLKD